MTENEALPQNGAGKPRFFYGYVLAMASFGIQVVGWGVFTSFGVFFTPLQAAFGWSSTTVSGIRSLAFSLSALSGIAIGSLNDRFGPRMAMTVCGLFFGLGYLLVSQVNSLGLVYLFYGAMTGIGISGVDIVVLSTLARWFVRKRGTITGIVKAGTGLGMVVIPLLASWIISSYGWRNSFLVLGIISLLFIVSCSQLLRRNPERMGQLPDGMERMVVTRENSTEMGLTLRQALGTVQFWALSAAYFTMVFSTQVVLVHIAPYAEVTLGASLTQAASVISVVGGASMAGRLVMGRASDIIGCKRALLICCAVFVLALAWLQVSREMWMLYLFAVVEGFCHGGFFTLSSPTIASLFGTSSHGVIFGANSFFGTLGGVAGPLLAGYIFDAVGSYQMAFLVLLVVAIIGLILILLLKPINNGGESNETGKSA